MGILLVAATEFEIRPILGHMTFIGKDDDFLHHYKYRSEFVDLLIPGIGMMQTAFSLGSHLAKTNYSLAVNAGIAGSYADRIKTGTVVNVYEESLPEMGAEDGHEFVSMFDLGLMDPDAFPYRSGKLTNVRMPASLVIDSLPRVKGNTVNKISGNPESIKKIIRLFPADVESMEGAAFLYACLSAGVPCFQIRAISNKVEERDKSKWNIPFALKNLNKVLFDLLQELVSW